jgi:phospholipid/cholesterol/gamma-HCH transport system substrate-binding protein
MGGNLVETLIGAVVLVVAAFFLFFAYSTADVRAPDGYPIIAKFDRVDGLAVGADVRLSGIKIGTVTKQSLDTQTFLAVVQLNVASNVQLPADTSAKIATEGLLGGNYLALEPGGSEDNLKPGEEIKYTQGSVDLMSLIGQAIFSSTKSGEAENQ